MDRFYIAKNLMGQRHLMKFIFIALLLLGAFLRLLYLTDSSIWLDEGYTLLMVKRSYLDIIMLSPTDATPPLGYLLYKLWGSIFGESVMSYEMLAVVFGVLSIAFIAKFATYMFDTKTALYSAFLLSISPMHIFFSQEIRAYSLGFFLLLLAGYYFYKFLEEDGDKKTTLVLFCILWSVLNTHYFPILVITSFFVFTLFLYRKEIASLKKILFLGIGLLLCCVPTIYGLYLQYSKYQNYAWIPSPSWSSFYDIFKKMNSNDSILGILFVVLFCFGSYKVIKDKTEERGYFFLLFWLFFSTLVCFLTSLFGNSSFCWRYFIFLLPPYLIIIAIGISKLRPTYVSILMLIVITIGTITPLRGYYQYRESNAHLKKLYSLIEDKYKKGDVIIHTTKFSFVPALFYHNFLFEEYLIDTATSSNIIEYWLNRKSVLNLTELKKYKRMWIYSIDHDSANIVLRNLFQNKNFQLLKPAIVARNQTNELFLVELKGASQI